jgi:myo-inositol-hexaphosphate 3-phosphohydrolase
VAVNTVDIRNCDYTNVGWANRSGSMTNLTTYCSLLEKGNYKNAFIGTDAGIYYTDDVTNATPTWSNINNGQLPNVQIFDIKQQTMGNWECYNSGQIYVATNGRGIWTSNKYYSPTVVSVKEIVESAHTSNLSIYPNPTTGELNITFRAFDDEKAVMNILDINGRVVMSNNLGKLNNGDVKQSVDVSALPSGMYIVNVASDSGIRRVSKLVITK